MAVFGYEMDEHRASSSRRRRSLYHNLGGGRCNIYFSFRFHINFGSFSKGFFSWNACSCWYNVLEEQERIRNNLGGIHIDMVLVRSGWISFHHFPLPDPLTIHFHIPHLVLHWLLTTNPEVRKTLTLLEIYFFMNQSTKLSRNVILRSKPPSINDLRISESNWRFLFNKINWFIIKLY